MRLPIQVQGIVFRKINGEIQFLLLKRIPKKGNNWQPVTGGVEKGEKKIEAVEREVIEETGIRNITRIIDGIYYYEYTDLYRSHEEREAIPYLLKEYVFGLEVSSNEKIVIDNREHSEYRWCGFEEALRLLKWKGNKESLKKLNEILNVQK